MTINKDTIKTLIDAQNDTGDSQVKKLLQALEKMRVENQQLQDKLYSEESKESMKTDKPTEHHAKYREL